MKFILYLFVFFLFTNAVSQNAIELDWAKSIGANLADAPYSIAIDNQGNTISTGKIALTGQSDVFIQKLDSLGNLLWMKTIGGNSWDIGKSVVLDKLDNIYILGDYNNTVDFDPGSGVFNLTSLALNDIFILKLNPSGDFIWVKNIAGSADADYASNITIDSLGFIYSIGEYFGTVDFNPNAGVFNLVSNGGHDVFIQKLDTAGNFIWAKSLGGNSSDYAKKIIGGTGGCVYIVGEFSQTSDFDPSSNNFFLTSNGSRDAFVVKLDNAGNLMFAKSFGGSSSDLAYSVFEAKNGFIYITGGFSLTVDFDPNLGVYDLTSNGGVDVFIQKMDSLGGFVWAKKIGGIGNDYANSISSDSIGNIYVLGSFEDIVDFNPGVANIDLMSEGLADVFLLKADPAGELIWVESFGGITSDYGIDIFKGKMNNIYISGKYSNTVDFDPSSNTYNLVSVGDSDAFIVKYSESSIVGIDDKLKMESIVYPNPVFNELNITFGETLNEVVHVSIENQMNQTIWQKDINQSKIFINTTEFPRGLYFLRIKTNIGEKIEKIIIH